MLEQETNILKCEVSIINKANAHIVEKFRSETSSQYILQNCPKSSNHSTRGTINQQDVQIVRNIPSGNSDLLLNTLLNKEGNNNKGNTTDELQKKYGNVCEQQNKNTHTNFSELDKDIDNFSSGSEESGINKIYDKPVVCRARATLPVKYLYIHSVSSSSNSKKVRDLCGVFAKRDLPKKTVFGPVEGVIIEANDITSEDSELKLLVDYGGIFKKLDISNIYLTNWMRYVRPARHADEQNLILYQNDSHLYFSTIRQVKAKEELKVWYSATYAKSRNLLLLPGSKIKNKSVHNNIGSDLWCCTHCRTSFKSATLLNLHVLTHAADNIETKSDIGKHLNKSKNVGIADKKLYCDICSKAFLTSKSLEGHLKFHELGDIYECPICKVKFFKLLSLKQHIPAHLNEGYYTCPHCEKKFNAYKLIRNHIRTYHTGRKFICSECPKYFPTSDKLRIHMLSHSELKEFLCANCGKQFKRKDKLSEHMKKFHFPENEKTVSKRVKISKKFILQKEAGNSEFVEPFIYKCHDCLIGFKRRGMLVNHLASKHPEITPESVPELNLPILKANKNYFCQYCDKIYKSSSKRKAHILKNHPGQKLPLSSRKVSKSNGGEDNGTYSQTVGSVTANPHGCEWCHKQYASKAKLLQHQRKEHNELLAKSLQVPRKRPALVSYEDEMDAVNVGKVSDADILLFQDPLDSNISDGEFIIDANSLKRALKGEVFIADCSPETLAELGQMIENRPDQYFRVYQTSTGITFARPVEVWDPLSTCQTLSPTDNSPPPLELKLN